MNERAAPPVTVALTDLRLWRVFAVVVSVLSIGATAAWLVTWRDATFTDGVIWPSVVAGFSILLVAVLLWRHLQSGPVQLRWDGQCWHWQESGRRSRAAQEVKTGQVRVAMDLGPWLLLELRPQGRAIPVSRWVPATRRGVGAQWHALRCALYSPPVVPRAAKKPAPQPTE